MAGLLVYGGVGLGEAGLAVFDFDEGCLRAPVADNPVLSVWLRWLGGGYFKMAGAVGVTVHEVLRLRVAGKAGHECLLVDVHVFKWFGLTGLV